MYRFLFPALMATVAAVFTLSSANIALAVVVFSDDFTDGMVSPWIDETSVTLSVNDDSAGLGSGNALFGSPSASVNRTLRRFDEITLAEAGDFIQVDLDFRFNGSVPDRFTPAFGLFTTNGTTADISNDEGYTVTLSSLDTGPSPSNERGIGHESPTVDSFGILAGDDVYNLLSVDSATPLLTNGENYTLQLKVTRNASGEAVIDFALGGDQSVIMTATDTTLPEFSFDQFAIRNRNLDFAIDNVVVTTNAIAAPIPEPGSLGLLLGLTLGLVGLRRRKR